MDVERQYNMQGHNIQVQQLMVAHTVHQPATRGNWSWLNVEEMQRMVSLLH